MKINEELFLVNLHNMRKINASLLFILSSLQFIYTFYSGIMFDSARRRAIAACWQNRGDNECKNLSQAISAMPAPPGE
jgi:hypothetical protein